MFRKLLLMLIFCTSFSAVAAEYRMVVPFAPGSQSDLAARQIALAFEKHTGDKILVESVPGGDSVLGVNHFKNTPNIEIFWTAASIVSFQPATKDNLPYSDEDFDHVLYVGAAPNMWIANSNSKYKTLNDLFTYPPEFVAGNSSLGDTNVKLLNKQKKFKASFVPFKGAPEAVLNVANGSVPLGAININPGMIEMIKAGKLVVLGSSHTKDITVDGITFPSIRQKTGLQQVSGFNGIDLKPGMDPVRAEKIKQGFWLALQDPETKEKLKQLAIVPDPSNDQKWIKNFYEEVKNQVRYSVSK